MVWWCMEKQNRASFAWHITCLEREKRSANVWCCCKNYFCLFLDYILKLLIQSSKRSCHYNTHTKMNGAINLPKSYKRCRQHGEIDIHASWRRMGKFYRDIPLHEANYMFDDEPLELAIINSFKYMYVCIVASCWQRTSIYNRETRWIENHQRKINIR
jgi:hypothetical protein